MEYELFETLPRAKGKFFDFFFFCRIHSYFSMFTLEGEKLIMQERERS